MKAFAAVASRNGRLVVENEEARDLAERIRQGKGLDPTLGIYTAYAYTQVGEIAEAYDVFKYMRDDEFQSPSMLRWLVL